MTNGGSGPSPDLSLARHDLGASCADVTGNLLANSSFETEVTGADPNGKANNTGSPASTIPGMWDGCCGTPQTTQWSVTQTASRCGGRSVEVKSTGASLNVLSQAIVPVQTGNAGKTFTLSGYAFVTAASSGGQLLLDVFDLMTNQPLSPTTLALASPTSDWTELRVTGTVPAGAKLQVRINTSGNVTAYVDDLAFTIN